MTDQTTPTHYSFGPALAKGEPIMDVSQAKRTQNSLKLSAISMIRNEADIVSLVLNQACRLFDQVMIVDIQSTDGTSETLDAAIDRYPHVERYTCATQERYQSAMMTALASKAVRDGADWVFFLDADEFIAIDSKEALENYLTAFPHDVMHMPWINLIPSQYGRFSNFGADQEFYWGGRSSQFKKVAVSCLYLNHFPEFNLKEGNYGIAKDLASANEGENLGLPLLHLPVRSSDRLKYKLASGLRLLGSKHNAAVGEGGHAQKILDFIAEGRVTPEHLNAVAANYGITDDEVLTLDPAECGWPRKKLPAYLLEQAPIRIVSRSLGDTLIRDRQLKWQKVEFVKGSAVGARIVGSELQIHPQPITGGGSPGPDRYKPLPKDNPNLPDELSPELLVRAVSASMTRIDVLCFSAWSRLIPVLYAMISVLRPRRYVELGVHNGMSFLAGCQIAKELNVDLQCVAVDSWIGDPHASFHSSEVFDEFREKMKELYPEQHYIQGFFSDVVDCFEPGSVDLLHIDGFHTYEAVREDFETWLPKMSETGVIIFHDVNVHERGFGVWRFWEELRKRHPGFLFTHSHGLGVLYVGRPHTIVADLFEMIGANSVWHPLLQEYFEKLGELSIDYRSAIDSSASQDALVKDKDGKIAEFLSYLEHRDKEIASLKSLLEEKEAKLSECQSYLADRDARLREADEKVSARTSELDEVRALLETFWRGAFKERNSREQRERDYQIIRESPLFDVDYYVSTNTDVQKLGMEPAWHFAFVGVDQLRNPRPDFDMVEYLSSNRDAFEKKVNPFVHYILEGTR